MSEKAFDKENVLILVVGPDGVGKTAFCNCFKNSFLRCLPCRDLFGDGKTDSSFYAVLETLSDRDVRRVLSLKQKGYRVLCYCLFASRIVCAERRRLEGLKEGRFVDNRTFREDYEDCYTEVLEIYEACDMFFFVTNQKFFSFSGVYTIQETPLSRFEKVLRKQKAAVDRIGING